MANELGFEFNGEKIRLLTRLNTCNDIYEEGYIFLHLIIDGKIKLFKYYESRSSAGTYDASTGMTTGGGSYTVTKYIMQKEQGKLFYARGFYFKKDMAGYLSDCPELAKKISEKIYRSRDIEQIIEEYNQTCK